MRLDSCCCSLFLFVSVACVYDIWLCFLSSEMKAVAVGVAVATECLYQQHTLRVLFVQCDYPACLSVSEDWYDNWAAAMFRLCC